MHSFFENRYTTKTGANFYTTDPAAGAAVVAAGGTALGTMCYVW